MLTIEAGSQSRRRGHGCGTHVDPPTSFIRTAPDQTRSPGRQLHSSSLGRMVRAERWHLRSDSQRGSHSALQRHPERRERRHGLVRRTRREPQPPGPRRFRIPRQLRLVAYPRHRRSRHYQPEPQRSATHRPPIRTGQCHLRQRDRIVLCGVYAAPFGFTIGGVATLTGGLPYNFVTGVTNSGDTSATTDRPVINGVVVGRDSGRGTPIYSVDSFIGKSIPLGSEPVGTLLRAEAFNVLNHRNAVGFSGIWGDGATPAPGFGQPLAGITAQLAAREMQFSAKIEF